MTITNEPEAKTAEQATYERNADHVDAYTAIWQDIVGGLEYADHLADDLQRALTRKGRNTTEQAARRMIEDRLHAGARGTAIESVWMGADELPFPIPVDGDEDDAQVRFTYTELATGPALWLQVVTPKFQVIIGRDGTERVVRAKQRDGRDASTWTTVGVIRDHKLGDESVERALAVLRGYVRDRRAGISEDDAAAAEQDVADTLDDLL